jgi:hypothetical protein
MNGKRAKSLRRLRAGQLRLSDIERLRRTEYPGVSEPKPLPERKKKGNAPTALARAAWGIA